MGARSAGSIARGGKVKKKPRRGAFEGMERGRIMASYRRKQGYEKPENRSAIGTAFQRGRAVEIGKRVGRFYRRRAAGKRNTPDTGRGGGGPGLYSV